MALWFKIHKQCAKLHRKGVWIFILFTSVSITVGVLTVYFTSPTTRKTCQFTFKRLGKSSITSGSQPRSVAVGDFNNDGQMDIVVANSGNHTISIFLSNINGDFINQYTYSTGSQSMPYSVIVNDFNNDNYLDIAVANYGANNIGIFLGSNNGFFAEQKNFSTGSSRPLFITTGDFNNNNESDIAVVNYGTNDISIFLGDGNGSFQLQGTYFTGYDSLPHFLTVADFDKDNHLDIAVANYGTNNICIFLGLGNGSFKNQQTYTTGIDSNPSAITIGDFNNDYRLDVAVANYGTRNVGIFLGLDNGTFALQRIYSIENQSRPQFITVGNFNNDNYLDVVVVDSENDKIHILLGTRNGTFTTLTTYDGISESHPFLVAVTDFDNDNRSDIAVVNYGANNVVLFRGYISKPSARIRNYFFESKQFSPTSVAIGDFDNDNCSDIVINIVKDSIVVLTGYNNGTFTRRTTYFIGNKSIPQYICLGDLNNDNRIDIVTANQGSNSIAVLLGYGNGSFTSATIYSTGIDSSPSWIALADINNDNQLDIISANTGSHNIGILIGYGNGTFATVVIYSIGIAATPYSIAVGDLNNDNHLDIVIAAINTYSIGIIFGHSNGTFGEIQTYSTGDNSYPISVTLADLNRDTYLDIIVTNNGAGNIGIFFAYGNGTFETQKIYSTGSASQPYSIIVADLNNDNVSDIAATLFGIDEVVVFFGYENRTFQLARTYSTGFASQPYDIAVADFNNDNQLEIVVPLWGAKNLAILTEYYAIEFRNQTTYSTGSAPQPHSIAIGDFNGNNRSDVVVANAGTDYLSLFLDFNNDKFIEKLNYSININSHVQHVITGDINKDGHLDIVTANAENDSISVIMGYGNSTFAIQKIYSTGDNSQPSMVAIDDLNNDNRSDLVVVNTHANNIGIFFGYEYASFKNQKVYSNANTRTPYMIAVNDFNNDSYLDIAVTFVRSTNIGIFLGYGNGSLATMMNNPIEYGSQPRGLVINDFNSDGRLDIAVTNTGTNKLGILLGYGNGSFTNMMSFSTGRQSNPYFLDVGDFNNDDRMDIVTANYGTNTISIFLGHNNGSFTIMKTYSTGRDSSPVAIAVHDFNNDTHLDIVVANVDNHNIVIFLGYGNGTFGNEISYFIGSTARPTSISVGDFNNDNQLDIVVTDFGSSYIGILFGYGNGTFSTMISYSTGLGSTPISVSTGDFNNDNRLDIAVANYGSDNIVILFAYGDGIFLLGKAFSTGSASQPNALAIRDFNNDTLLDIAVANFASDNIGIFLGYGNELFAVSKTISTGDGSLPHSVALGDFNHDNQLDMAVANYGTNNIGILLGHGNGNFNSMITYPMEVDSNPYSLAIGDFNNDNQTDIVVINSEIDCITIFLGNDNGTFVLEKTYSTGARSRPYGIAITDFNNDNNLDIIVANSGTNNILLFYGFGNGTFGNEKSYSLGYDYHPYSIAINDLNQDGWMDIVIACYGTDTIEILMNMCL